MAREVEASAQLVDGAWVLHVEELDLSWSDGHLDWAVKQGPEVVADKLGIEQSEVELRVVPVLEEELREGLAEADALGQQATALAEQSRQRRREVMAAHAKKYRLTQRELALILGMSVQRVSQILKGQ